jgi:hypothetical protein
VVGDVAGHTAAAVAGGGMHREEEGPEAIRLGLGDGTVAAAGTEDVGGRPCRVVALAVVVEEGKSPSGVDDGS